MKLAALALLALAGRAPQTEFAWDCKFTARYQCSPSGCTRNTADNWIKLSPSLKRYWRCGPNQEFMDCDEYPAVVSSAGDFQNFELPGHAAFARIASGRTVTEVITQGATVITSYGRCIEGPPPIILRRIEPRKKI